MRLLIISSVRGDTRRYRTIHLWEQANLLGLDVLLSHITDTALIDQAETQWDMVVMHRVPYDGYVERLSQKFRSRGALIFFDVDDLIFEVSAFQFINSPDFADPLRASLYKETMQQIRRTLVCADGAIASTDYLAHHIRAMGKPVWIHRNAFSLEMLRHSSSVTSPPEDHGAPVVVGYASGTPTHNRDFALIRPALKQILSGRPDVRLQIIGPLDVGDDWGPLAERISCLPLVSWRELPGVLAKFDINLAPLVTDNPFSQSKSEIKYMEAAMVGVPTVASATDAFRYAIRNGENGFLAGSTEEWVKAIESLVNSPELRHQIGKTAQSEVNERYHPAARADDLQMMFREILERFNRLPISSVSRPELLERAAARLQEPSMADNSMERDPTRIEQGLYTLRHAGLITLIKMMLVFFRRLVSPVFPYSKS